MKPTLQSGWNGMFAGSRDQWKSFRDATALHLESKNAGSSRYADAAVISELGRHVYGDQSTVYSLPALEVPTLLSLLESI